jgi:hypothetical protein
VIYRDQRTRALDIHEIRVGRLHQAFQLVLSLLRLDGRVEEVDGELNEEKRD